MFGSRTDKCPNRPDRDREQLTQSARRKELRQALTVAQDLGHLHESPQEVMHAHRMFGRRYQSDEVLGHNAAWESIFGDGEVASCDSGYGDADLQAEAWAWHDREATQERAEIDFAHELDLLELMGAKAPTPREGLSHDPDDVYGGFVDFPWHIDRGFAWRS